MQKTFILVLFCSMLLGKLKAQDSVSTFFVNLNVNIIKNIYTNYLPGSQIGSEVKNIMNIFKPSILIKTKKRNFREFELTNFLFSNSISNADRIKMINFDNSGRDTSFVYDLKNNTTEFEITHRFSWNFLKKKSKEYGLGLTLSNSIGVNFNKRIPLSLYAYPRTQFSAFTTLSFGLFANYQLNNKILIGIQKNLIWASANFIKQHVDNPLLPEQFRNQSLFDFSEFILHPYIPSIFAFNIAYKL